MILTSAPAAPTAPTAPTMPAGPLGRVIAASLAAGALGAGVLTLVVLPDAPEATVVGAALAAFAGGWGMVARLSARLTTRPQRWAYVPAAVLALAGGALVIGNPGEPAMTNLAWVWAPGLLLLAGWTARRIRPSWPGLPVHLVALAMALAGLGGLAQATTEAPEAAARPGRLVDVGGYRLHLDCSGTGSPTVVLLNGLGETSPLWARISPAVARTTRVCAYDRAGQGWSEDSPQRPDSDHAVADLHHLLTTADEPGPYVLAGHSLGGAHALTYAARYPRDVAGVVLLDSVSPDQVDLVTSFNGQYQVMRQALAVAPTLFRLGLGPVARAVTGPLLPGAAGEQVAGFANSPRGMRNLRAEQAALPDAFRQARALTTLGATPLVVLTARENVDQLPGWGTAQDGLAALSTDVRHATADVSHVGLLVDPAGSAQSVDAVTDVVAAVRSHTPLRTTS